MKRLLDNIFMWRKKWSALNKLKRAENEIRELWETTRTEHSKSFDEVMQDLRFLIKGGKAFPVRTMIPLYFQFRLQKRGARLQDYIFTSEWASTVVPLREWAKEDCDILNDKIRACEYLAAHGIAVSRQYGKVIDSSSDIVIQDKDGSTLLLKPLLEKEGKLFAKPHDGIQGIGCFLISYIDDEYCLANDEKLSYTELKKRMPAGYLVEQVLRNHPTINAIYPFALNTVRIVTMRDTNGKCHYVSGFHRFGVGGATVDNAHSGGVAVGLDAENGCWKKYVFADNATYCNTKHPDSGFVFENKPIPYFKEAVELALRAHDVFKKVQAVGWDVAITPEGPLITEGNHNFWYLGNQFIDKPIRRDFDAMTVPCQQAVLAGRNPWPMP